MVNLLSRRALTDPLADFTRLLDDFLVPTKSTFDKDFFHPQIFNKSTPSVEVYETDDSHVVEIAAPGLNRDNLEASLEKRTLTVTYTNEHKENERRSFSSLTRSWAVPEGTKAADVSAEYKDGILTVNVNKPEVERLPAQSIDIK